MFESIHLTGRDGDVGVVFQEGAVAELGNGGNRPAQASPEELPGERHIDDNFLLNGLGGLANLLNVFGTGKSDPASEVEEANGGDLQRERET